MRRIIVLSAAVVPIAVTAALLVGTAGGAETERWPKHRPRDGTATR